MTSTQNSTSLTNVCSCGHPADLVQVLDSVPPKMVLADQILHTTCTSCGTSLSFRISDCVVDVGFTYWAGSMHFETLNTYRIEGFRVERIDPELVITFSGREWRFPLFKQ